LRAKAERTDVQVQGKEAPPRATPVVDIGMRVVITHDFMEAYGGAERVTAEMAALFPDARVVAFLARPEVAARMGIGDRTRSLVAPRERILRRYRLGAALWGPYADAIRLEDADVVLSSSYAYAHRLRTRNDAPIVCYCHSPLRFAWSMTADYRRRWAGSGPSAAAFGLLAATVRRGDRASAQRVHSYLTQSPFTADQIREFYGREADVIGAPVDCELFCPGAGEPSDHYLLVSRLVEPYKRVGAAVEAFRRMPGERLIVAGDGPAMAELRAAAPPNVTFTGHLDDAELVALMQSCRAAIFPSRDDFGLVPVEIMACGRPVLAYADGGALHTVKAGVTGAFFATQTPEAIVEAVRAHDPAVYDPQAIREHALQWDRPAFRARLLAAVERATADNQPSESHPR
jgi:glycosyltransferase involved in cell wall biosynthesis